MRTFNRPTRVWINQPSTLQPLHELHGQVVTAWTDPDGFTNIYFNKGNTHSMRVGNSNCLESYNSQANIFGYDN